MRTCCASAGQRAEKAGLDQRLDVHRRQCGSLALSDKSFDAFTIAFGIRNVPRIELALAEAYRVLKPGGRFLCLEFSEVQVPMLDRLYDFWSFEAIPRIGQAVAGSGDPYRYLVESIRKFPKQEPFKALDRGGRLRPCHLPQSDGRRRRDPQRLAAVGVDAKECVRSLEPSSRCVDVGNPIEVCRASA